MAYVKINAQGAREIYPYTLTDLRLARPDVKWPQTISDELAAVYGVFAVQAVEPPLVTSTQAVDDDCEKQGVVWVQTWTVRDATEEELADRKSSAQSNRASAYSEEADPLYFKWQRNEGTEQEWLDKVAEIRGRYPYPGE